MGFLGEKKNSGLRSPSLLSRMKLRSREKGRLIDHGQDGPSDQVPIWIEMGWIDGLNVENVLCVVGVANSEIGIVLKWEADQIGDGILRRLAQVFSLLGMDDRCPAQTDN